jgi:chromosome segregation ATPase
MDYKTTYMIDDDDIYRKGELVARFLPNALLGAKGDFSEDLLNFEPTEDNIGGSVEDLRDELEEAESENEDLKEHIRELKKKIIELGGEL